MTITITGIFGLFLSPESGDKLNLSIAILLGFLLLQIVIADLMPKTAGLPKIGLYLINSLILSAGNVVIVVLMIAIRNSKSPPIPRVG